MTVIEVDGSIPKLSSMTLPPHRDHHIVYPFNSQFIRLLDHKTYSCQATGTVNPAAAVECSVFHWRSRVIAFENPSRGSSGETFSRMWEGGKGPSEAVDKLAKLVEQQSTIAASRCAIRSGQSDRLNS